VSSGISPQPCPDIGEFRQAPEHLAPQIVEPAQRSTDEHQTTQPNPAPKKGPITWPASCSSARRRDPIRSNRASPPFVSYWPKAAKLSDATGRLRPRVKRTIRHFLLRGLRIRGICDGSKETQRASFNRAPGPELISSGTRPRPDLSGALASTLQPLLMYQVAGDRYLLVFGEEASRLAGKGDIYTADDVYRFVRWKAKVDEDAKQGRQSSDRLIITDGADYRRPRLLVSKSRTCVPMWKASGRASAARNLRPPRGLRR
jgi:hypothetical protein